MIFASQIETAWYALTTHRMRSFLTKLGMVIGVAAVILMLAIGQGAQAMVRGSIRSMGSTLSIIMSGATTTGGTRVAVSEKSMEVAETAINDLLRSLNRIAAGQEDDFTVHSLTALAETAASTTRIMSLLLGAIAAISLVVGGIGIMNIMRVSVTERTREIGIRMAIGARSCDVPWQFLIEALTLSLIGRGGRRRVAGRRPVRFSERGDDCFGFDGGGRVLPHLICVFFGFFPAHHAAGLDPIEALRAIAHKHGARMNLACS
jgi:ABC-type antimicrobial peptide transport system permease subunit